MNAKRPVERLIVRLITILSEEMLMYNELLHVLRKKQANIIESKVKELGIMVNKEQNLIAKTQALSETRQTYLKKLSTALEQEPEIRTLGQLIDAVEAKYADRLEDIHESMKRIMSEVKIANEENRYLLNYSIQFVREAARELVRSSTSFPVYSAEGKGREDPSRTGLIEGRI